MARHYLARHARPEVDPDRPARLWNLSNDGKAGARRLASTLVNAALARVVTSDEPKSIQTGQSVAAALNIPMHQDPDLCEHKRDGATFIDDPDQFQETIRQLFEQPERVIYGTETAGEALSRFSSAVTRHSTEESTLMVTHGTVLSLYVASITGRDGFEIWSKLGMPCLVTVDDNPRSRVDILNQV